MVLRSPGGAISNTRSPTTSSERSWSRASEARATAAATPTAVMRAGAGWPWRWLPAQRPARRSPRRGEQVAPVEQPLDRLAQLVLLGGVVPEADRAGDLADLATSEPVSTMSRSAASGAELNIFSAIWSWRGNSTTGSSPVFSSSVRPALISSMPGASNGPRLTRARLTGSRRAESHELDRPEARGHSSQSKAHRRAHGLTGSRAHGLDRPDLRGPRPVQGRAHGLTVQALETGPAQYNALSRQSAGSCAGQYSESGRSPAIEARIIGVAASPR